LSARCGGVRADTLATPSRPKSPDTGIGALPDAGRLATG
jgi:hypothetical protein